ncbi:MAG: penicillin acylase family protein [Pyrinomonadaceae bacterium]|nr:penicillin acylase family protein [Pyrinomonadaceae bacterium]
MKKFVLLIVALVVLQISVSAQDPAIRRLEKLAARVTITRDTWGIAHVKGKTDADAVFGAMYAQAEDDFNRIETNYLNSLGRLAEAEGEKAIWSDLRQRLFIDAGELKVQYLSSPAWLRKLMNAWADGLNYYLATHPNVKPRVITKFEPWMPLSFSEGSIGGDIESIDLAQLRAFYDGGMAATVARQESDPFPEPLGSNGFAISPKNAKDGKALLLVNPHTSFFFRSELQMTSDEGLNAYGASTWGQFFIYQGFNERLGWMHTSSDVDAIDEWLETIVKKDGKVLYKHGSAERPMSVKMISVPYRTEKGLANRTFTTYSTHHGPVIRAEGGKWVSIGLMNEPVKALMQSYGRTKAKNYKEFKQVMQLQANSSNATIYADADGNIAYIHPNFIPRRDTTFDWKKPVDGSDPASDWKGLHTFDESPNLFNPASGWLFNTNNWPWSAAGPSSLKQSDYPKYVDNGVENARGIHAIRLLENRRDFTLESLNTTAYDSLMPWFEKPIPALIKAWDQLPAGDPLKEKLSGQIAQLRNWDMRWSTASVPTSLAVFWGEASVRRIASDARRDGIALEEYIGTKMPARQMLETLAEVSDKLAADFGTWKTPWGEINRFQRLTNEIIHPFDDSKPSIPVGFASGNFGSLASFGARSYKGSKKIYGTYGNSFVAVVEFGKTVRARAITAGGQSGDVASKHFNDQAERYSKGDLREVYFYPAQLRGNTERSYVPGK